MYPEFVSRQNVNYFRYAEIAMEHYWNAKQELANTRAKVEDYSDFLIRQTSIENDTIISVIFSSMAIEAFFNDYAATCFGDNFYYGNFDSLSLISKFQLISKCILNVEIDKSTSYYGYLKELIKLRNGYVHSKSTTFHFPICELPNEADLCPINDNPKPDFKALDIMVKSGLLGIKTIYEIAKFFDTYDKNVHAVVKFFKMISSRDMTFRDEIFKKLSSEAI